MERPEGHERKDQKERKEEARAAEGQGRPSRSPQWKGQRKDENSEQTGSEGNPVGQHTSPGGWRGGTWPSYQRSRLGRDETQGWEA